MGTRFAVVVTGAAGAGKTTLSLHLGERLNATVLSKDLLKEAMCEPLGLTSDERSLQASAAAMRIMFDVARRSRSPLVMEANWKAFDVAELHSLDRPLVQVFCDAPAEILESRIRRRIESGERHHVHRDRLVPQILEAVVAGLADTRRPLELDCPVLTVTTVEEVDVDSIAQWITSQPFE